MCATTNKCWFDDDFSTFYWFSWFLVQYHFRTTYVDTKIKTFRISKICSNEISFRYLLFAITVTANTKCKLEFICEHCPFIKEKKEEKQDKKCGNNKKKIIKTRKTFVTHSKTKSCSERRIFFVCLRLCVFMCVYVHRYENNSLCHFANGIEFISSFTQK